MKLRIGVLIFAASFSTSAPAKEAGEDLASNVVLKAFLADIRDGRAEKAERRIASVETLSGKSDLAKTPREFVERLNGCTAGKVEAVQSSLPMVNVEWQCKETRFFSTFDLDYAKPYLTIADFVDEAGRSSRRPPMPPPLLHRPSLLSAEVLAARAAKRQAAFDTFGLFFMDGLNENRKPILADISSVKVGRRNPVHKVTIEESDDEGFESLIFRTEDLKRRLGTPAGFSCDPNALIYQCKFTLLNPDSKLYATLGASDGKITFVEYLYATRESVEKDMVGPE